MSSWTTVIVDGMSKEDLPDEFDDWNTHQMDDGRVVTWSFNPGMSPEESSTCIIKSSDDPVSPPTDRVLVLRCNDTSDYVAATLFRAGEVKWNGIESASTRQGHHYNENDSEILDSIPDRWPQPTFGGNWSVYDGGMNE